MCALDHTHTLIHFMAELIWNHQVGLLLIFNLKFATTLCIDLLFYHSITFLNTPLCPEVDICYSQLID